MVAVSLDWNTDHVISDHVTRCNKKAVEVRRADRKLFEDSIRWTLAKISSNLAPTVLWVPSPRAMRDLVVRQGLLHDARWNAVAIPTGELLPQGSLSGFGDYSCLENAIAEFLDSGDLWRMVMSARHRISAAASFKNVEVDMRRSMLGLLESPYWIPTIVGRDAEVVIACERPTKHEVDSGFFPHCETGPALEWEDGYSMYFLGGNHVAREDVMCPKQKALVRLGGPRAKLA